MKVELEQTACYGVRVYTNTSWLANHVDTKATHAVSVIMQVDQVSEKETNKQAKPTEIDVCLSTGILCTYVCMYRLVPIYRLEDSSGPETSGSGEVLQLLHCCSRSVLVFCAKRMAGT